MKSKKFKFTSHFILSFCIPFHSVLPFLLLTLYPFHFPPISCPVSSYFIQSISIIVTHLISLYSFSFPRIMPDNFISLILQNFHQLQRTRYTCDLLDQLCLFVSTYYHRHLSFPHQYPTRETSLKTTKQQNNNLKL